MVYETKKVGVRTKTTVAILYMRDIVDPKIVQDVKNKLDDLHIDGAFSATQLEELMEPTKALFPLMGYTGRPDFTVKDLANALFRLPWPWRNTRPDMLKTRDSTRQGDRHK